MDFQGQAPRGRPERCLPLKQPLASGWKGRAAGEQTQARRWVLEQGPGREDPTQVPPAHCAQATSPAAQGRGRSPWHSPGQDVPEPSVLQLFSFYALFLPFQCSKINLKTQYV